jgi:hypothetical protein
VRSAEWSESDMLLMFRGKIYVLKDRELRCCIMEQHHDMHIIGHSGCFKTLKLLSCNRYIRVYIKNCNPLTLQRTSPPEDQWDVISVKFLVELPQVHDYDVIMVVIGSVTK